LEDDTNRGGVETKLAARKGDNKSKGPRRGNWGRNGKAKGTLHDSRNRFSRGEREPGKSWKNHDQNGAHSKEHRAGGRRNLQDYKEAPGLMALGS